MSNVAALGAIDGHLLAMSKRYLRAVASRNRHAKRYAEELAQAVLGLAVVKLAQSVLEGGELTYSSATRLADAILAAAEVALPTRKAAGEW
jgi:hypothetical protein